MPTGRGRSAATAVGRRVALAPAAGSAPARRARPRRGRAGGPAARRAPAPAARAAYDICALGPEEATRSSPTPAPRSCSSTRAVRHARAQRRPGAAGRARRRGRARPCCSSCADGRRPRLPPRLPGRVDDFVSGGLGERQLLARVQRRAARARRGWPSSARKNAELQGLYAPPRGPGRPHGRGAAPGRERPAQPAARARCSTRASTWRASSSPSARSAATTTTSCPLGPHRLAFAIGDVMGKGVPAALLAANLKASMRAQVQGGDICPEALVAPREPAVLGRDARAASSPASSSACSTWSAARARLRQRRPPLPVPGARRTATIRDLVRGRHRAGPGRGLALRAGLGAVRAGRPARASTATGSPTARTPEGELYGVERLKEAAVRSRRDSARASPSTRSWARSRAGRAGRPPRTTRPWSWPRPAEPVRTRRDQLRLER